jgi:DNA polymerase-3 subunit delta'
MIYPWLEDKFRQLVNAMKQRRMPHALLFSGPEGVGKRALAEFYSQLLLCQSPISVESLSPCQQCKSCMLLKAHSHPDLKIFSPEDKSKVIKIDEVRLLNQYISQSSQQGGLKIALISPATALNRNAANALLKTLEEPATNSLIILIAHQPGKVLPTIRSRCQVVDFSLPSAKQSLHWLSEEDNNLTNEASLRLALTLAGERPLIAKEFLKSNIIEQRELIIKDIGKVLKAECTVTEVAENWKSFDLGHLSRWMLLWSNQLIKFASSKNDDWLSESTSSTMLRYLADKNSIQSLFEFNDTILEIYQRILSTNNPNPLMQIEQLLMAWQDLMPQFK